MRSDVPAQLVAIPAALLARMRDAASEAGRDLASVWAEAARDWLARQDRQDDEPLPPAPAAALALPRPHDWSSIDAVLADLRQPTSDVAAYAPVRATARARPAA